MARLIFIILLIGGVFWVLRRLLRARLAPPAEQPAFQATVRCRECGAYVARREAVVDSHGPRCRIHKVESEPPET